jgi:hypothetical protein
MLTLIPSGIYQAVAEQDHMEVLYLAFGNLNIDYCHIYEPFQIRLKWRVVLTIFWKKQKCENTGF